MSEIYYRHWKKMFIWPKIKMWTEKKLIKQHNLFGIFNHYDTSGMGEYGGGGKSENKAMDKRVIKFLDKYPHAADHYSLSPLNIENNTQGITSPAIKFLSRQEKYIKEGFTEDKSFELAEKDMSEELQSEKYERSLFEGAATSNKSRSLMSIYEQKAEYESRQKVSQMERSLGQFKRYQGEMERKYEEILNQEINSQNENVNENIFQNLNENIKKYEPVTYRTADMPNDGRNFKVIQQNFTNRSERLLDYFNSFAEIKDGISGLTDKEIVLKANETPQKLKDSLSNLKKKLEKYNVELNSDGKINYDKMKDYATLAWLRKNERIITICLLCKDLDFELPHKINRTEIKNKILLEIESEQERLKEEKEKQSKSDLNEAERLRRSKINYENYFGILPNYDAQILQKVSDKFSDAASKNMKKFINFDEFVKDYSNNYMFDNDLLYETYYYWEDAEEKEIRLRELWINSKKNKLDKSITKPQAILKDLNKTNEEISEIVRSLRKKIDQVLLKNNKHPVFGANYKYYKYDEFMLDSEIEFHKIKKFLQNSPESIKNDPEVGYKYKELINLLQRKKIGESSTMKFGDEKNIYNFTPEEIIDEVPIEEIPSSTGDIPGQKQIDKVRSKDKKVDKVDKELGKVKEQIVTHFENILKTQGIRTSKDKKSEQALSSKVSKKGKPIRPAKPLDRKK